jgi:hypothetical protein
VFYADLCSDAAHPTVTALNRYLAAAGNAYDIDVDPKVTDDEIADTLNLLSLAALAAVTAANELLGGTSGGQILDRLADEYLVLMRNSPIERTTAADA